MGWMLKSKRDTGLFDVSALSQVLTSGTLMLRRTGDTTWLMGDNVRLSTTATGSFLDLLPSGSLPVGMRPQRTIWQNILTSTGGPRRLASAASGWVPLYGGATQGDVLHFTIGFPTTGAMPETIPGVKI